MGFTLDIKYKDEKGASYENVRVIARPEFIIKKSVYSMIIMVNIAM